MESETFLNIQHLSDTYILNSMEDIRIVKEFCKQNSFKIPPMIIYGFNCERYKETSNYPELETCPDVVANVFMDYTIGEDDMVRCIL